MRDSIFDCGERVGSGHWYVHLAGGDHRRPLHDCWHNFGGKFDAATLQGSFDAAANQSVTVPAGDAPGNAVQPPPLTFGGRILARQMKTYWANFVKTATPNGLTVPIWQPFNFRSNPIKQLTPTPSVELDATAFSNEHNCGFWGPILNPTP
jgi:hypothetical protein